MKRISLSKIDLPVQMKVQGRLHATRDDNP